MAPQYYQGGSPPAYGQTLTDNTWASGDHWEHKRDPNYLVQDTNNLPMQYYNGDPHTSGALCLFADGSGKTVGFGITTGLVVRMWAYNDGDAIAIRSQAHLALTFDHRLIDGALADQFCQKVKSTLENWSMNVL